ncbi:ABC transporter ATP-binding protein [Streptococcus pyogenes]|uniref:ABC transporter ATP-binding protein n=1 Tax=Streptococcus pyogenes TaxID=1314 RepID=UPI001368D72B|nr:energy-coupling factor ABC transporter ATP-binding protein [Streptococcus pyogenes]MYN37009.1 ATP-binding cassette domain-containing protein [Streptococcus pyogenes]NSX80399.1 energy-coupling factor ABC transporter ATP-binding protein [Streptococcus pyogenes]HEQ2183932.1 energy-coupling factor ABC transporter ATP-binding protein [Streptococcus pyogenes]HER2998249.1 energy-coupling factor ABC transporter ATP-binding protein [Streptococcus pyogenes]HER3013676.1 energy-coupling factor ABC tran
MIEFKDVSFTYDSGNKNAGIYNINLNINAGEVVVFCGESGCGKTTISRLINGLIPGYYSGNLTGSVIVNEHEISKNSINELSQYVGSVFQNPRTQFFNVDSTSEIAFACENFGISREEICKRIGKVTKELNIKNLLDKSLFSISGGEKQKIACASAAAMEPEIYVLDEPSSNLDIQTIKMLKDIIKKWKEKKSTVVIAEHRLQYLIDIADRFIYMKDGEINNEFSCVEFKELSNSTLNDMGLRSIHPIDTNSRMKNIESKEQIEIKDFMFSYGKKPFLEIHDAVLPQKSIVAVLGNNGSGKSTFSKCLCGVEEKAKGTLKIETKNYDTKERLKKCFMVMQDVNHQLFTESVKEEILLSIENDKNKEEKVDEICKKLNLMDFIDCHPMSLSGGQKQRVAIASAIASDRTILILDEPTSGLDFRNMKEVSNEMMRLKKDGKTIFIITHDPELVECCCDYFMFMENGKVKWHGGKNEKNIKAIKEFFNQTNNCL